jgi:hypothetical protein
VSRRIGEAIASGKSVAELGPTAEITTFDLKSMRVEKALDMKKAEGGTAPQRVKRAAVVAKRRIKGERS